jgi:hypothetical protein
MFKIQDELEHVKLVHAQKLGPNLLTFVNLNLGVNPDVAYVYVKVRTFMYSLCKEFGTCEDCAVC